MFTTKKTCAALVAGAVLAAPAAAELSARFLPAETHYPRLAAWMRRVEALPGFDRTWPPHWRAADLRSA